MLPRSRPLTDASTAMRRVPASRRMAAGPNVCVTSASWPSGIFRPSWPSMSSVRIASKLSRRSSRSRTTRSNRRCPSQICDCSSPTRPTRTARITSPGARPTRAVASRFTAICNCGSPVSCSARKIRDARRHRESSSSACSARRDSSSRSGPKIRTDRSAGVPPRPSSIRMPSGVVNRTAIPGMPSSCSRMSASIASRSRERSGLRTTSTSETVCGIGSSVRSARPVRRTTSSTSGHLPQDVLDAMIQPVDFVERRFRRQHRLQQKRSFVQLRHEVAADAQAQARCSGPRSSSVTSRHDDGMAQATIQRRRIPPLDLRRSATSSSAPVRDGFRTSGRGNRHQRQRQDKRRGHGRNDRSRQRLIHAAFDAGHAEQRQEHDDDDQRRERDRPRDFDRGRERSLPTLASSRGTAQPMQDVLDHDDRGIDQQADGDRQAAQRHRVQPDAERLQQQPGQRNRQRNRERHDQRGANVAEQHQNDEHDEHAAEHHRAADAAKRRRHELRLVVDDAKLDALRQRRAGCLRPRRGCRRRRSPYPSRTA